MLAVPESGPVSVSASLSTAAAADDPQNLSVAETGQPPGGAGRPRQARESRCGSWRALRFVISRAPLPELNSTYYVVTTAARVWSQALARRASIATGRGAVFTLAVHICPPRRHAKRASPRASAVLVASGRQTTTSPGSQARGRGRAGLATTTTTTAQPQRRRGGRSAQTAAGSCRSSLRHARTRIARSRRVRCVAGP